MPDEARAIPAIGVDHIGVLVSGGEFPREPSVAAATGGSGSLLPPSKLSPPLPDGGLEADHEEWARQGHPDIVHLGCRLHELLAPQQMGVPKRNLVSMLIMRSVPVTGTESIEIARRYDGIADFLLLDSHRASDRADRRAVGWPHDKLQERRIEAATATGIRDRPGHPPAPLGDEPRVGRLMIRDIDLDPKCAVS